jgi:hypothetical protein
MRLIKTLTIMLAMILLVSSVCFAPDQGQADYDAQHPYYWTTSPSNGKWHSSRPATQNNIGSGYYHVTGSSGNWQRNEYNSEGTLTGEYRNTASGDITPPEIQHQNWQQTAIRLNPINLNNDKDTNDPGEAGGLYYYADPAQGQSGGYHDSHNNYYNANRNLQGRNFDPATGTYIPTENSNIRLGTDGKVYADRNGDGKVNVHDIDLNGDGQITPPERTQASVSNNYNHESGRFLVLSQADDVPSAWWMDENGNLYRSATLDILALGRNTQFYADGSFSYRDAATGETSMVLPNGQFAVDVKPDGQGGYYQDVTLAEAIGPYEDNRETTIHFVATGDNNYVGLIDGWGQDYVFLDANRDGRPDNNVFTINSAVHVTDSQGTRRYVVEDEDGRLYELDGLQDLDDLFTASPIQGARVEELFGRRGFFFMSAYGTYRLGEALDEIKGVVEGYPGFSIFYDQDDYNDWLGVLDNDFIRTLFGGMDAWGEALFCRANAAASAGSNIAGGAEAESAAAYISAEEYRIPDPADPAKINYLYMLEFYAFAGQSQGGYPGAGCSKLDFQVLKQGKSLFKDNQTQEAFTWQLVEGDTISYTADAMWLGIGTATHVGENVCIKFTEMIPNGCLSGYKKGESLCDAIVLAAEESYDFECDGWHCSDFIGFVTGAPGREGWSFPAQTGSGQTTAPTPTGDTTDPNSGAPVLNFD